MRVVFLLAASSLLCHTAVSQLPYFSTQVGESTYIDNSGKTKSYRELENFETEMVPVRAHLAASRCLRRVDTLMVLVSKLQLTGSLSTTEAAALKDLLIRAQYGNHELLTKLSSESPAIASVALYHNPLLLSSGNTALNLANVDEAVLSQEEQRRFATYKPENRKSLSAAVKYIDTSASITIDEADIASFVTAAHEYADLNKRAASYFLGVHMFLGETSRKGPLPVRSLKESAFFFHGREGANALSSASLALNNDAQPSATVQLISMALPLSNLTVSSTANAGRDTSFSQQVIDKLVYGGLGNLQLEVPLLYKADKTTKAYFPLMTRVLLDRMSIKDELTSETTHEDLIAFGVGTFATLDFSVRNPLDNKHAGIYFRMSYELIGTEGAAGDMLISDRQSKKPTFREKGVYHLAQFDFGFRGSNGVVIGFQAPVRLKNEDRYLASDKWRIGVSVEPGKW
jgi:hypothetical protein